MSGRHDARGGLLGQMISSRKSLSAAALVEHGSTGSASRNPSSGIPGEPHAAAFDGPEVLARCMNEGRPTTTASRAQRVMRSGSVGGFSGPVGEETNKEKGEGACAGSIWL